MQKSLQVVLFVWLLVTLSPGTAGAVSDLYVAETRVSDESSETRNSALSALLSTVLVRVSGNTGIAGQPAARELLEQAPSLVQQYRYRTAEQDGAVVRFLWARFDQPAIERMMRERNLPVWTQRPTVLLWVVTERAGQRSLLNLENEPEALGAVEAAARERGLPLQLPLLDLEDQSRLTPADVWSDYQPAIRTASTRYPHDLVLTGRLRARPDGRWSGVWSLLDDDGSQGFQVPDKALPDALVFAMEQAQNLLAARYAPMPGAGGARGTLVRFADVRDLAGYGRLVALFDGLDPVAQVALRHVGRDEFTFELRLRGSEQDLARSLASSGQLVEEPAPLRPQASAGDDRDGGPGTAADWAPAADFHFRLLN